MDLPVVPAFLVAYKSKVSEMATAYNKRNTVAYGLRLNIETDKDIITALESVENINGFLKKIIREKIAESETGDKQ